jgi:DNA-binding response OmpR family regulator
VDAAENDLTHCRNPRMIEQPAMLWDGRNEHVPGHRLGQPRVLVLEARPALRSQIGRALRRAGLEVDFAADAEEAALRADTRRYAMAVLDMDLPGGAALRLCRRLARGRCKGIRLPVLALSTTATRRRRLHARLAGARACLARPMQLERFVQTVWTLVAGASVSEVPPPR